MDWVQFFTTTGSVGALSLAIVAYLRSRPEMKLAQLKGEDGLWARIERMEARHAADTAELKAEIRVLRHERNNLRQAFNAMLVLLKKEDADLPKIIEVVEELVERGDNSIAAEKAAISLMLKRGE